MIAQNIVISNCRCTTLEVFYDENPQIVEPSSDAVPDEGWAFNPGTALRIVA